MNPGYGESLSNAKKKNQPEDQGRESDHLHLMELKYMATIAKVKPSTRVKRTRRITARRRFRFQTAHVRSMRITGSCHNSITTRNTGNLLSDPAHPMDVSTGRKKNVSSASYQ